jgi:hypothetical protein
MAASVQVVPDSMSISGFVPSAYHADYMKIVFCLMGVGSEL